MRIRTTSSPSILVHTAKEYQTLCNNSVTGYKESPWWITPYSKTTEDVVTPNFRARVAAGEVIINPFKSTITETHGVRSGVWKRTRQGTCSGTDVREYVSEAWIGLPLPTLISDAQVSSALTSLTTVAGTAAAAGVKSAEVAGLVEMAEFGKTIAMIANPLSTLSELLSNIAKSSRYRKWRKRQPAYARSLATYISSEWLRYRYGILPLMSSMDAAIELLTVGKASPPRETSRGYAETTITVPDLVESVELPSIFSYTKTSTHKVKISVRAGVLYETVWSNSARWGFSIHDVPKAGWELIPFSFVADWVLNIGDFISAITPKIGVNILGSWTKTTVVTDRSFEMGNFQPLPTAGWTTTCSNYGKHSSRVTQVTRNPGVSVGLASKWTTIDFDKSIHQKHLADLAALIIQQLFTR